MKYVFDRKKLKEAIMPSTLQDLFYNLKLTPSQMQIFFYSEPTVERLLAVGKLTHLSPLTLVKPHQKKEIEHVETPIHQNECLSKDPSDDQ